LWVTDAARIVPLPDLFSFEQGALVEPLSVAVHAVGRAVWAGGGEPGALLAGRRAAVMGRRADRQSGGTGGARRASTGVDC
jgi:threonine dehydrogenase-like Zn-dependent dehydrogenase